MKYSIFVSNLRASVFLCVGLLVLLTAAKKIAQNGEAGAQIAFIMVAGYQIYLPLLLIKNEGTSAADYGLKINRLESHELIFTLKLILITFFLYGLAFAGWQLALYGQDLRVIPTLPPHLPLLMASNIFLVAVPEEFFYRGFLQTRLLKLYPNHASIGPLPVGRVVVGVSLVFALGHWLGDYNLGRLATFFPAMLFSALVFRYKSIVSAVIFHALCNVYSEILTRSFIVNF